MYLSGRCDVPAGVLDAPLGAEGRALSASREAIPFLVGSAGTSRFGNTASENTRFASIIRSGSSAVTDSERLRPCDFNRVRSSCTALAPQAAVDWFRCRLRAGRRRALDVTVSRTDLFVRLAGWIPVPDDRASFVTRAKKTRVLTRSATPTGLRFGRRGSGTDRASVRQDRGHL